jgi:hypothetical protein
MENTNKRLDLRVNAVANINHLSGLIQEVNAVLFNFLYTQHDSMLTFLVPQANKEKRGAIFKKAESYVKEYRDAEREKIRLARLGRQKGSFYVEEQPKLVFVIRIKGLVAFLLLLSQLHVLTTSPNQQYLQDCPQTTQDPPAPPPLANQQRRLRPPNQSHARDAHHRQPIHRLRLPEPQVHPRAHLQAGLRQDRQAAHPPHRQPAD